MPRTKNYGKNEKSGAKDLNFFKLFLRFNHKLVLLAGSLKPPLSVSESHIMADIMELQPVQLVVLADTLGLNKSTISRGVASLLKQELVDLRPSTKDRRAKELSLTPKGAAFLSHDTEIRNQVIELCIKELSKPEQEKLRLFLAHMANKLGARMVKALPQEHGVEREVRRLTRAMGFIKPDFASTKMPVERCQALLALQDQTAAIPLSQLRLALPYEVSAFSRLLKQLEKDGYIEKRARPNDRRHFNVALTQQGKVVAARNTTAGEQFIENALLDLASVDLQNFREILNKFLKEIPKQNSQSTNLTIRYKTAASPKDRQLARVFIAENLVRLNKHHSMPESLVNENSPTFIAMRETGKDTAGNGGVVGVAQFSSVSSAQPSYESRSRKSQPTLQYLLLSPTVSPSEIGGGLLNLAVRKICSGMKVSEIELARSAVLSVPISQILADIPTK